jgi:hypothetical protein
LGLALSPWGRISAADGRSVRFLEIPAMAPAVVTDRATRAAIELSRSDLVGHNFRPSFIHGSI